MGKVEVPVQIVFLQTQGVLQHGRELVWDTTTISLTESRRTYPILIRTFTALLRAVDDGGRRSPLGSRLAG